MKDSPTTTLVAAKNLDGVGRSTLPKRDFADLPTVNLAFIVRHARGMPADWVADATAELERRAEEAREYTGQDIGHVNQPIRLPSGYRFFGGR